MKNDFAIIKKVIALTIMLMKGESLALQKNLKINCKDNNHIELLECKRLSFVFGDSWAEMGHLIRAPFTKIAYSQTK